MSRIITGPLTLPVESDGDALELHRLYVVEAAKGKGVAQSLCANALAWAATRGAARLYLSMFEHNARAQAFYRRNGFEIVSEHRIKFGETPCRMLIMSVDLK